jgi:HD-GYP domain-containing protein (c-di-GMP phosphodiesterase class II)
MRRAARNMARKPAIDPENFEEPCVEETSSSARALAELIGLAAGLNSAESSDDLLTTFAKGLTDIWPGAGVRLCEVRKQAKCLVPHGDPGADPIPLKGSFLGSVAADKCSRRVPSLIDEPDYLRGREAPSGVNWRSAIACPIPLAGDPVWVVGVFLPDGIASGLQDLILLERATSLLEPLVRRFENQGIRLTAFREIAHAIASAVDARDPHLVGHGGRVCEFAQAAARIHGMRPEFIDRLGLAGLLHDIGRLGIPERILSKPGSLTPEEYRIVQTHPGLSEHFLEKVEYLKDVLPAMRHHHERYDGGGYPSGLEADDIPLAARLLTVADAFDAMTSPRPFRGAMSDAGAIDELRREQGKQFDPILVEAFLRAYEEKLILSQNVLRTDDPLAQIRTRQLS